MTTLRILLAAAPSSTRADAWALFDAAGRCLQRGHDVPAQWPKADAREAVLAASLVRVVSLALPPMVPSRVATAAAFALEDRLAATGESPAMAFSAQRADGTVLATVTARPAFAAIIAARPPFARVLAEPALAPVQAGWTWYASAASGGFVRTGDGSAFAVGAAPSSGELPAELASALAQAVRTPQAPAAVSVAQDCDDRLLAQWSAATGVTFRRGESWQWDAASAAAFGEAPDLLQRDPAPAAATPRSRVSALFRPALAIVAAALVLHVGATLGQWAWLKYEDWQTTRALAALAQAAGQPDAATPEAALRAVTQRHAELRHRAALAAPADALPLLARAAPALAALPAAALKTATYTDGAWTLELGALDAPALAALDSGLSGAGLSAVRAKSAAGYRMRLTLSP